MKVKQVMLNINQFPIVNENTILKETLEEMDKYGLGIHSTLDMSGKLKFGPDVDLSSNSLEVNTDLKDKFSRAIKSYWKGFDQTKLVPDYAGLRPKIVRGEEFAVDFAFQTLTRNDSKLLFLHGIESPGLTSSLSIGQFIAN